jgi:hypothetical protein
MSGWAAEEYGSELANARAALDAANAPHGDTGCDSLATRIRLLAAKIATPSSSRAAEETRLRALLVQVKRHADDWAPRCAGWPV